MSRVVDEFSGLRRARRIRTIAHATFILWAAAWIAVCIALATKRTADLVSALAVVICLLFGSAVAIEGVARRIEARELRAIASRRDLSAARSRGTLRVR